MTHSNKIMLPLTIFKKINVGVSIFVLIMIGLSACETQPVKRVTLRQGMDYKALLQAYGKPHAQSYIQQTELTHYSWQLSEARLEVTRRSSGSATVSRSGTISSGSNPYQNTTVRRIYCRLTVMVDQQNKVASWEAEGMGCRQILYNQI